MALTKLGITLALGESYDKNTQGELVDILYNLQNGENPLYKSYVAIITQEDTAAPIATVFENTLGGTLVWARIDVGEYSATLAGAFVENKTSVSMPSNGWNLVSATRNDANTIIVSTANISAASTDGILFQNKIEIRIYN